MAELRWRVDPSNGLGETVVAHLHWRVPGNRTFSEYVPERRFRSGIRKNSGRVARNSCEFRYEHRYTPTQNGLIRDFRQVGYMNECV